jgi:hypothetical protein
MKKKTFILLTLIAIFGNLQAQKFDGFVITDQDSLFKGYMRIFVDGTGRKILLTKDKRKTPKIFRLTNLKYYAYKKDTFAILKNFYPFDGEEFQVEFMEAKVIIQKGRLKLYYGVLQGHEVFTHRILAPSAPNSGAYKGVEVALSSYRTYIVKNEEGVLKAIKIEKDEFFKSIEIVIGKNSELLERIRNKEFRFKDTKRIIEIYNE